MNQYDNWQLKIENYVATLTLDRPDDMNNLTVETLHELRHISSFLATRSDIWVIVLEGRGKHFSSGVDLNIFREQIDRPEADLLGFVRDQQRCLDAFASLEYISGLFLSFLALFVE